jgi:hypothetical protein
MPFRPSDRFKEFIPLMHFRQNHRSGAIERAAHSVAYHFPKTHETGPKVRRLENSTPLSIEGLIE